ncbi:MAG: hypothetical protein JW861_09095 [Bacteroidales bacterium]|nr:hypothetical protein [Bacteroidales bacterium]
MWAFNINGGQTSFYGDLSIYDSDLFAKLSNESGPAFSIIAKKHFNKKFGIGGQLLTGKLKGENSLSHFEATLLEYNFHGLVDIKELLFPYKKKFCLGAILYAGVGQFRFNALAGWKDPDSPEIPRENTGVPEFVYFLGGGAYYKINEKFRITADIALRQAQNDKLDVFKRNNDYDYYTYISFGASYHVQSLFKSQPYSRFNRSKGRFPMRRRN